MGYLNVISVGTVMKNVMYCCWCSQFVSHDALHQSFVLGGQIWFSHRVFDSLGYELSCVKVDCSA